MPPSHRTMQSVSWHPRAGHRNKRWSMTWGLPSKQEAAGLTKTIARNNCQSPPRKSLPPATNTAIGPERDMQDDKDGNEGALSSSVISQTPTIATVNMRWRPAKKCLAHGSLRLPSVSQGLHIVARCRFARNINPYKRSESNRYKHIEIDATLLLKSAAKENDPRVAVISHVLWERACLSDSVRQAPQGSATAFPDEYLAQKQALFNRLNSSDIRIAPESGRIWIGLERFPFAIIIDWLRLTCSPAHSTLLLCHGLRNLRACIFRCLRHEINAGHVSISSQEYVLDYLNVSIDLDDAMSVGLSTRTTLPLPPRTLTRAAMTAPPLYSFAVPNCEW